MKYKENSFPSTFTLTTAIGETVVGTPGDDTFRAVGGEAAQSDMTLNISDAIDGAGGTDTLNLIITGTGAPSNGVEIKNIEIVNLNVNAAVANADAGFLTSAFYEGAEQLWQADSTSGNNANNFGNVTVSADVTAGFRSTGTSATASAVGDVSTNTAQSATGTTATVAGAFTITASGGVNTAGSVVVSTTGANTITAVGITAAQTITAASASQKTASVALDGVLGGAIQFVGAGLVDLSVSGTTVGSNPLFVDVSAGETLSLALENNVTVGLVDDGGLETIDFSSSTGNITLSAPVGQTNSASNLTGVDAVIGGQGNDTFTIDMTPNTGMAVDAGAGNDTVTVEVGGATQDDEGTIALGAGEDTLVKGNLANITSATEDDFLDNLVTVTDFSTADDTLNLGGNGVALTNPDYTAGNDSLWDALADAAADIGANSSGVFSYDGNAYVFEDRDNNGTVSNGDGIIMLTGVDATEFANVQNGNLVL